MPRANAICVTIRRSLKSFTASSLLSRVEGLRRDGESKRHRDAATVGGPGAIDERKPEILDLPLAALETANRVLRSNGEAAHKATLALTAQRIIRLLNGGKRRHPCVRPSELARAKG
jgi:hypothetical protein